MLIEKRPGFRPIKSAHSDIRDLCWIDQPAVHLDNRCGVWLQALPMRRASAGPASMKRDTPIPMRIADRRVSFANPFNLIRRHMSPKDAELSADRAITVDEFFWL